MTIKSSVDIENLYFNQKFSKRGNFWTHLSNQKIICIDWI